MSSRLRRLDQFQFIGLVALLMFGPLAFGAVEPWAQLVLRAGAVVLLATWVAQQLVRGEVVVVRSALYLPLLALGALIVVQLVLGLSVYRQATAESALNWVAYGMVVFLMTQSMRRQERFLQLAWALAIFGFVVAVFALLQDMTATGKLYWLRQPQIASEVFGPYVNRNHYAGLMELLTPLALVLAASRFTLGGQKALLGFAGVVMAGSVYVSGSRGGAVVVSLQLVLLALWLSRRGQSKMVLAGFAAACLMIVGGFLWVDSGRSAERLSVLSTPAELGRLRAAIARDTLAMAAERPLAGWGLGNFTTVYPRYQSFHSKLVINAAHNDHLQLLAETGVLGLGAFLLLVFRLYRFAAARTARWWSDPPSAVRLAALAGCGGLLVHGFFDFNLQIPANAALFLALAAAAAADVRMPPGMPRYRETHEPRVAVLEGSPAGEP